MSSTCFATHWFISPPLGGMRTIGATAGASVFDCTICRRSSMYCMQSRSTRTSNGLCSISNTTASYGAAAIACAAPISAGENVTNAGLPCSSARIAPFRRGISLMGLLRMSRHFTPRHAGSQRFGFRYTRGLNHGRCAMPITLIENFRAVFYAPFYACAALGAYRAEGVEVTMRVSAAAEKTLTTGDVSWGGPLRVMKALDGNPGAGYVAFCEVVGRDPFFLLGRTPNPQFGLNELIGTRVAVVSEVPTPWICLQYDLRRAGIDPAAIALTPARSMAENAAALRAGDVDVIQVFQPYARELIDAKAGHVWYAAANRGLTSYTT